MISISDDHQIVRGIGSRLISIAGSADEVPPSAFDLRPRDRGQLSCQWVECPGHPPTPEAAATRIPLNGLKFYCVLPVRSIRTALLQVEGPDGNNCHARISGFPNPDQKVALLRKQRRLAEIANASGGVLEISQNHPLVPEDS